MMLRIKSATALLFSLSLLFTVAAFAQDYEKPVKMKDLPEAVRKTVQEQSKGASLQGLAQETKEGKTFYEAELKVMGHKKDVLIDPSGAVVEVEEEVSLSTLSPEVKATIQKNAGKGKIESVESITRNNNLEAYEAHVKTAGRKSEIKVAPDGLLISVEDDPGEEKASTRKAPKTKKP